MNLKVNRINRFTLFAVTIINIFIECNENISIFASEKHE